MADTSEFFAQYQHPLWQKKRLAIMERDGFRCINCGSKDDQLQVHHTYYEKGRKPWEYEDDSLECLCVKCHKTAQENYRSVKRLLGQIGSSNLERLIGYMKAMAFSRSFDEDILLVVDSNEEAVGIAQHFDMNNRAVEDILCSPPYQFDVETIVKLEAYERQRMARALELYDSYLAGDVDIIQVSAEEAASV